MDQRPICCLSIVIYHHDKEVERCLNSIQKYLDLSLFQIKIIDNEKKSTIGKDLKEKFPFIQYYNTGQNLGFGNAHNIILETVNTPYVLILNPDTELLNDGLMESIRWMEENEKVGVLTGKMFKQNASLAEFCYQRPKIIHLLLRRFPHVFARPFNRLLNDYVYKNADYSHPFKIDWCSGAFMLVRGALYKELNGFDGRFFMYFEDTDFCRRAQQLGHQVMYHPSCEYIHHWKHSSTHNAFLFYQLIRSMFIYYYKWGAEFF